MRDREAIPSFRHLPEPCPGYPESGGIPGSLQEGNKKAAPERQVPATLRAPGPLSHLLAALGHAPSPAPQLSLYLPRMFLSMASECLSCPCGHFCGASGLTAPSGPCSPGYFCLTGVTSPNPTGKGPLRTGVGPALTRHPRGRWEVTRYGQFVDRGPVCEQNRPRDEPWPEYLVV